MSPRRADKDFSVTLGKGGGTRGRELVTVTARARARVRVRLRIRACSLGLGSGKGRGFFSGLSLCEQYSEVRHRVNVMLETKPKQKHS